jgi:acetyl esterase/lipase
MRKPIGVAAMSVLLLIWIDPLAAQESEAMRLGVSIPQYHRTLTDITYISTGGHDLKLDVYPSEMSPAPPTLIYIHGGGWMAGSKELSLLNVMPWMAMGWTVVNVEYRTGRVALAPAAVEDVRCAVRFVLARAKEYNIDPKRVVLAGHSAGAHLALMTGFLPVSAGLDRQCAGSDEIQVAAIVSWYGIADVADLIDGPNAKEYAVRWIGSRTDREEAARRVSPLRYVRAGVPPVIIIHGDADDTVPYAHATRLKAALDRAGAANELVTIEGGRHGFRREDQNIAYAAIERFLARQGLME